MLESVSSSSDSPPRFDSIQHAGLGTAFTSTGVAAGFFAGALDEARVWNYARSAAQITDGKTREIPAAPGSAGSLGLQRELRPRARLVGQQPARHDVAAAGWTWVAGAPFTGTANAAAVGRRGADQAVVLPAAASLIGTVTDDGISGLPLVISWTKTSGPGTVTSAARTWHRRPRPSRLAGHVRADVDGK